ncbi:hypothetical protein PIB30_031475 [Stylosanthes scabra]|uniref:RRM domain-containing protein n=1 Tax=Stylosanthes scabra TaxID=79078 RepID=A0ABU6VBZ6_9FABA|nr:hypothetical protein [Stylosanthes scabra]
MRGSERGNGGRRVVWHESRIHSEGSGHAEGRNKEESGDGFASGVWRNNFWDGLWSGSRNDIFNKNRTLFTAFVDNLSPTTTKRNMYKEFGKDGYIKDIYVSRKRRRETNGTFAFVRFCNYGSMRRAVVRTNGMYWNRRKIFVSMSKFTRDSGSRATEKEAAIGGGTNHQQDTKVSTRKEVHGVWAEDQKEKLQRSLLGVCVEPIQFRRVMNRLLEEWSGPGSIECQDVGPYRCLVTFSSPEIRDAAMNDDLLLSSFDEVRPHWGFVGSLSRRIWVEIMGLSMNILCGVVGENSDGSCPFSPGFGPYVDQIDVHRELVRAQLSPHIAEGNPDSLAEREATRLAIGASSAVSRLGDDDTELVGEDVSDETLYKINVEALKGGAFGDANGVFDENEVSSAMRTNLVRAEVVLGEGARDQSPPLALPFSAVIGGRGSPRESSGTGVWDEADDQCLGLLDDLSDDVREEEDSSEIVAAREVWNRGGLSFVRSDEEEIVDRLTNRKKGGQKSIQEAETSKKAAMHSGKNICY